MQDEPEDFDEPQDSLSLAQALAALRARWALMLLGPLACAALAFGATYLVKPTFTALTRFMPPQQSQSGAASALQSLGALSGLAAGAAGVRSSLDQYVSLMQGATISDRIIDQFKLQELYEERYKMDARKTLATNVRIGAGKKDGLITVEVDDTDPKRAAAIANRYIEELRLMTANLAMTEAQQRRIFFERQLATARDNLAAAQRNLQSSGFNPDALKAEPKAAADAYARMKADLTLAELRLQTLRGNFAESAPEVRQQQGIVGSLRERLARSVSEGAETASPDYIGRFREYRYQETLYELYARQFELARADEAREGALIQVVDAAAPPERKSKPKRTLIALAALGISATLLAAYAVMRRPARLR